MVLASCPAFQMRWDNSLADIVGAEHKSREKE
jgi:hypothetical protein